MPYLKIQAAEYIERHITNMDWALRLRVVRSSGVTVNTIPTNEVNVEYLSKGKKNVVYPHIYSRGAAGIAFKVTVLIGENEIWNHTIWNGQDSKYEFYYPEVRVMLNRFYRRSMVLEVVSDFIDINDGKYVLTKIGNRKQVDDHYVTWELEFTMHKALNQVQYKNDNTLVKKAIKSATAKKTAVKTTSSKKTSTKKSALAKCNRKVLVYSKKKKTNDCVKKMQKILKNKGFYKGKVDGWYGDMTVTAVKNFQKKYKKKYKLGKPTGKVDEKTFKALKAV